MKPWDYDPSPDIQQSIAEKLTVFPRERDMTHSILRTSWTCCFRAFLKTYLRLTVVGRENLPASASYVLVANHSSHLDAVCLAAAVPLPRIHRTFSVAARDYFFSSFFRSFCSAIFVNALPFDRLEKKRESLELCADVLDVAENVLIMFPEGTRSLTGEIQTFKAGIGILTAGTDRLVLPAYIDGAFRAWPKGCKFPRPRRVRVIIGQPMSFKAAARDKEGFLNVAQQLENAVRDLAGGVKNA
ncbi:MAG: lysophospholipid acyltransferase family protein [Candidatus Omnitrophota bacterium]|nr:lysophospholipid acyltransferase family protein [Candidatus Omnitrophota bacterium]MDZ4242338.1 lysophospholipid acyltransferase family protein [Candidatus Omnitrophota bacterium]